jgi:ATP-dependent DNA helicase RecG
MARTTDELLALLADLESDQVERKESLSPGNIKERVCQAICAFANDMPDHRASGVIFIGATDNGRPTGATVSDRLLLTLADLRDQGRILPPPIMSVRKMTVDGYDVAVVEVEPSPSPPVRFNGQVWIRVGPRRAIATADEERRLGERRRSSDLPFDARPTLGSSIADLDVNAFEREYLPSVLTPEVVAANGRSIEQRLSSLRLTTVDGIPTNAGLLIIGVDPTRFLPGAYVQFLRVAGQELDAPIIDERRLTAALPALLGPVSKLVVVSDLGC